MKRKRVAVTLGLVALTAYAILKAAWGLGSLVGIEDRAEFDRVFGGLTPSQVWLATWGTVILAAAGGALWSRWLREARLQWAEGSSAGS